MPAPAVPGLKEYSFFLTAWIEAGSSTVIIKGALLLSSSLPTSGLFATSCALSGASQRLSRKLRSSSGPSLISTSCAREGAVQWKVLPDLLLGRPSLAVHFPGALPVNVTSSPTPTSVRVLAVPSGAAKVVSEVIFGALSCEFR